MKKILQEPKELITDWHCRKKEQKRTPLSIKTMSDLDKKWVEVSSNLGPMQGPFLQKLFETIKKFDYVVSNDSQKDEWIRRIWRLYI